MPPKKIPPAPQKDKLHVRNKHNTRYDFPQLVKSSPELSVYVSLNAYNDLSIDFKDAAAVKALNRALLKHFYGVQHWDIPQGYLCPPIPGRADYIHYLADLLAEGNQGNIPRGKTIKVLDVGVGANGIYPLIGHHEYGWTFIGSEVDAAALKSVKNMVEANGLSQAISIRKQTTTSQIFKGIINPGEKLDATMCNPPFHASQQEALAGTQRKWKNLGEPEKVNSALNFGGRQTELWYPGGEEAFVRKMIVESTLFATSCRWFTSLISKKETLPACYYELKKANATQVKTINMAQGQKVSRILAWSFTE